METRTWSLLKSLLADALERPRNERGTFIARACGNSGLYDQACALLEQADDDDFLGAPFEASLTEASDEGRRQDLLGRRVSALRIERLLGTGGMGDVYLAVADHPPGLAAIKVLDWAGAEMAARALTYEHQVLSLLQHPLIVRSHGLASVGDQPCLVMDYIDGLSIDEHCALRRLGVRGRVDLVVQVCAAVAHAHERGIVHADIKPSNILVTPLGEPRLVDFGIASQLWGDRVCSPAPVAFAAFTPECASPEQWRRQLVSRRTDVYAIGTVLYRLLTGRLPYERQPGLSTLQRLQAMCHDDLVPPSCAVSVGMGETVPGLPPPAELARRLEGELDRIICRALAREPQDRYASIAELVDDLVRACRGSGASLHKWPWHLQE